METTAFIPRKFYFLGGAPLKNKVSLATWGVYLSLANFQHRKKGGCFPSVEKIADNVGCSLRAVYMAKNTLKKLKLIDWKRTDGTCHYEFFDSNLLGNPKKNMLEEYTKVHIRKDKVQLVTAKSAVSNCKKCTSILYNNLSNNLSTKERLNFTACYQDSIFNLTKGQNMQNESLFDDKHQVENHNEQFEEIWNLYPVEGHRGKSKAVTKTFYQKSLKRISFDKMRYALLKQLENRKSKKENGLFVAEFPHLFRWLRDQRWLDNLNNGETNSGTSTHQNIYQELDQTKRHIWKWIDGS